MQVFVGSALESSDAGVEAIKAWAVDKLPEGPTLYPKVSDRPKDEDGGELHTNLPSKQLVQPRVCHGVLLMG